MSATQKPTFVDIEDSHTGDGRNTTTQHILVKNHWKEVPTDRFKCVKMGGFTTITKEGYGGPTLLTWVNGEHLAAILYSKAEWFERFW